MKSILINYANNRYYTAQKINSKTGKDVGGFEHIIEYSHSMIDDQFYEKYKHILTQKRGAGYWLWKPYIILKTLNLLNSGDIVFYSDAGCEFISSAAPLINICINETSGVVCFAIDPHKTGNPDVGQIKRDALILMDCDNDEYINSNARLASFIVLQKNEKTIKFVTEWLSYCCDERILTDLSNTIAPDHSRFIEHRHDQAVFSILSKKYGYIAYLDPSQWGIPFRGNVPGNYNQIINHTRMSS
tara:strand:+ start:4092 stop:4823 length:732 start_codon:yes stop_codon:yes gene_type:complete